MNELILHLSISSEILMKFLRYYLIRNRVLLETDYERQRLCCMIQVVSLQVGLSI